MRRCVVGAFVLLLGVAAPAAAQSALPPGFVRLADISPTIRQDIRYAGARNFLGRPVAGYAAAACILTEPAARGLDRAQREIAARGLTLVVFDCYRPERAVRDMMAWLRDPAATAMAATFHPREPKAGLSLRGYIASRSGHSRGSAVDLGIARIGATAGGGTGPCTAPAGRRIDDGTLDFGTAYDCFDPLSAMGAAGIGREATANRAMLTALMRRHGFRGYAREWWHFQLANEPFPARAFDFPVTAGGR
ncbi:M15 family metallopeptidase [Phreatobacter sp.]|uniref:M15 family metallopeptidase n=1 Tax=Phreatobacter sp. TaxID=1966341 RepID=UPI003F7205BA